MPAKNCIFKQKQTNMAFKLYSSHLRWRRSFPSVIESITDRYIESINDRCIEHLGLSKTQFDTRSSNSRVVNWFRCWERRNEFRAAAGHFKFFPVARPNKSAWSPARSDKVPYRFSANSRERSSWGRSSGLTTRRGFRKCRDIRPFIPYMTRRGKWDSERDSRDRRRNIFCERNFVVTFAILLCLIDFGAKVSRGKI